MPCMRLDNPFLIRGYAGPEYFCDRTAETQQLVSAISNGRDVTLVAPRRYGKTGLVHTSGKFKAGGRSLDGGVPAASRALVAHQANLSAKVGLGKRVHMLAQSFGDGESYPAVYPSPGLHRKDGKLA